MRFQSRPEVWYASSALTTVLFGLAVSAVAAANSDLMYAGFKEDPDSALAYTSLFRIALAGTAVHTFYLLALWETTKKWAWQRWFGEVALGGVTAWVFAAIYYLWGPQTTPLGLSIAGVFGGFLGQRGLVWAWVQFTKIRAALQAGAPPKDPPAGGTPDA